MRTKPIETVIEARVVKRFNTLHEPLVSLIQALQDMVPEGSVLGDKVEFTKVEGHLRIGYGRKPVELVVNELTHKIVIKIEPKTTTDVAAE